MYAGAGITTIPAVLNLVTVLKSMIEGTTSSLPPTVLSGFVLGTILIFVAALGRAATVRTRLILLAVGLLSAASLVDTALWILMAVMNRRGRDWARLTAIALFALYVVNFGLLVRSMLLGAVLPHFPGILLILDNALATFIGLAAIILLLTKQSASYFQQVSRMPRL